MTIGFGDTPTNTSDDYTPEQAAALLGAPDEVSAPAEPEAVEAAVEIDAVDTEVFAAEAPEVETPEVETPRSRRRGRDA